MICAKCHRIKNGKSPYDWHHVAGKNNSPVTLTVPVNEHRAEFSVMQQDWPKKTLENKNGSFLLAGAASIRGMDNLFTLLLLPAAERLEYLESFLAEIIGPKWSEEFDQYVNERQHTPKS